MLCRHRRLTAWVLLCTLVLAAMAPAVARAMAVAQGSMAPWSVVCSSPADAPQAPADDSSHARSHCAWCNLHLGHLAPPPAAPALHGPVLQDPAPGVHPQVARPLSAWLAAQARAPPGRSA